MALDRYEGIVIVDDSTSDGHDILRQGSCGTIPRDYSVQPYGSFGTKVSDIGMEIIEESNWAAICKEQKDTKSRIVDILRIANNGNPIKALYQNGWGYCWAYSFGHAVTAVRAVMGLPYKVLSPFAIAHIIKRGKDEGGWCGLSAEFGIKNGIPTVEEWPNLKAGLSQDTSALRELMKKYRPTESIIDMSVPAYDRNLKRKESGSILLARSPVQMDFDWWGHSVCCIGVEEVEPGSFAWLILNSHGEDYESQLMYIRGSKMNHMGAVGHRVVTALTA